VLHFRIVLQLAHFSRLMQILINLTTTPGGGYFRGALCFRFDSMAVRLAARFLAA